MLELLGAALVIWLVIYYLNRTTP